jgi:UDP-N-acetylglucosamine 3-dehydrogenase
MESVRVAIIGCGAITEQNHLPAMAACHDVEPAWFVDSDQARARAFGTRFNAGWSTGISEVPHDIDAVLVATPNAQHAPLSIACMEQGHHVMCEKPVTTTATECAHLCQVQERTGLVLAIVHQIRFMSTVVELKRLLSENRIGTVSGFDLSLGWKFAWRSRTGFYMDQNRAGGGALMDLGPHLLDLVLWLFGSIADARMEAIYEDCSGDRMDTAVTVFLTLDTGVEGTVRVSRLTHLDNAITVRGQQGQIRASLESPRLALNIPGAAMCHGGRAAILETDPVDPFAELWQRFGAAVRAKALNGDLSGLSTGTKVMEIIDRLYGTGRSAT